MLNPSQFGATMQDQSVFFLFRQWKNVVLCVFVWHVCDICQCTHKSNMLRVSRSEDKFQELVSPPPWVPRLKLWSSALPNKHFSYWTILLPLCGQILTQRHPYSDIYICLFEERGGEGSLCSFGCPETHYLDQDSLELPVSASQVLGWQLWATMLS